MHVEFHLEYEGAKIAAVFAVDEGWAVVSFDSLEDLQQWCAKLCEAAVLTVNGVKAGNA